MNLNSKKSVFLLIFLLLGACSTSPERPVAKEGVDVTLIPEPIPKAEPLSKTGNPESYEQFGKRYWVMPNATGFVERGKASWYGKKFDGKRTSSGETYNMYDMTAAHRTLPLPTYIQVTNLGNNRNVIVRVNDRGPFAKNRILDLSYAAASKLSMVSDGTAVVEIKVLNPGDYHQSLKNPSFKPSRRSTQPSTVPVATPLLVPSQPQVTSNQKVTITPGVKPADQQAPTMQQQFYVQVGAYAKTESAEAVMLDVMEAQNQPVLIVPIESVLGVLHRVRIGPFDSKKNAEIVFPMLRDRGYFQYRIVRQ